MEFPATVQLYIYVCMYVCVLSLIPRRNSRDRINSGRHMLTRNFDFAIRRSVDPRLVSIIAVSLVSK